MNLHREHSPIASLLLEMDSDLSGDQRPHKRRQPLLREEKVPIYVKFVRVMRKYLKFIGPGIMVSVLYLDPGNYSSSVSAGFTHKYKLLFSILVSTMMACFLQILCIKLGTVTGLDLAQNCREHLPHRLNVSLYILLEIAIIATDLAEVVGTAISLQILFGIPLFFGVILTVVDVLLVLLLYRPNGPMFIIRIFEAFITVLVGGTVICFIIELCQIAPMTSFQEVMEGFLPSKDVFQGDGLYLSLAILGATVMPHSLYLGSGLVQTRLREFDEKLGNYVPPTKSSENDDTEDIYLNYRPSLESIHDAMHYSVAELILSLFTVALFVNSAILIVAGSALGNNTDDDVSTSEADLFTIYELLTKYLSKSAGILYALALLLSGQSAGVVCTLAGQMVSEGFLHWTLPPALRRLLTRAVLITPCLILVLVSGRKGLSALLNASQVVLLLLLPVVSAPLIYFTCNKQIMRVPVTADCNVGRSRDIELDDIDTEFLISQNEMESTSNTDHLQTQPKFVDMSNGPFTAVLAVLIWGLISCLNLYLLLSMALGREIPV